jgi:hypothetical protein
MAGFLTNLSRKLLVAIAGAMVLIGAGSAGAQVKTVDPDKAIDGDLVPLAQQQPAPAAAASAPVSPPVATAPQSAPAPVAAAQPAAAVQAAYPSGDAAAAAAADAKNPPKTGTYREDDVVGAAEGVFGKGAKGLADVIKGEPNGYIVGREGGLALIAGVRYGSGTLYHKIEGQKPVYWTGPSIGFDAGANAGNTFVLVYNLYNTDDIYKRFGAGEGQAYFLGGFHVSYLRHGDVVLIPVRMGVGLRLGVNAGYMKITRKSSFIPF